MITEDNNLSEQVVSPVLKYKDLISKSDTQIQSEQLALDVQKAKSTLEVSIAQTALDLAEATQRFNNAKGANPYCLKTEIRAYEEMNSLQEGLEYAKKVLEERF